MTDFACLTCSNDLLLFRSGTHCTPSNEEAPIIARLYMWTDNQEDKTDQPCQSIRKRPCPSLWSTNTVPSVQPQFLWVRTSAARHAKMRTSGLLDDEDTPSFSRSRCSRYSSYCSFYYVDREFVVLTEKCQLLPTDPPTTRDERLAKPIVLKVFDRCTWNRHKSNIHSERSFTLH